MLQTRVTTKCSEVNQRVHIQMPRRFRELFTRVGSEDMQAKGK
jgi:hypothetical protein